MEALIHLTDIEIEHRTAIASRTQITVANFPYVKRLSDYDFTFQPAISKSQLTYFISCHDLIQNLKNAYDENRLVARLKHYNKYYKSTF